jgi:hypothetical protein
MYVLKETEQQKQATERLKQYLKAGDTVYTVLTHVSRSRMMRHIKVLIARNNEVLDVSYYVSHALNWPLKDDGVKIEGCGMDMGYHLVYSLSSVLFRQGFDCIDKNCPSNDHVNGLNETHHKDGGYALIHRWL